VADSLIETDSGYWPPALAEEQKMDFRTVKMMVL
jgi:hypothetical protein